jgi:hypothetical protein
MSLVIVIINSVLLKDEPKFHCTIKPSETLTAKQAPYPNPAVDFANNYRQLVHQLILLPKNYKAKLQNTFVQKVAPGEIDT